MKYYRRKKRDIHAGRNQETLSLRDVMKQVLKSYKANPNYQKIKIQQAWVKVMGETVAKRTGKLFVKNKKLFVEIQSAPLRKEMTIAKPTVLTLVNKELNDLEILDVVFL